MPHEGSQGSYENRVVRSIGSHMSVCVYICVPSHVWLFGTHRLKPARLLCPWNFWVKNTGWKRKWQPTPVFFPGKVHGQKSLAGCSPWGYMTDPVCTRVEGVGLVAIKWQNLKKKYWSRLAFHKNIWYFYILCFIFYIWFDLFYILVFSPKIIWTKDFAS